MLVTILLLATLISFGTGRTEYIYDERPARYLT